MTGSGPRQQPSPPWEELAMSINRGPLVKRGILGGLHHHMAKDHKVALKSTVPDHKGVAGHGIACLKQMIN